MRHAYFFYGNMPNRDMIKNGNGSFSKRTAAVLFSWGVGLRAASAWILSLFTGIPFRNLALFYDGHMYLLIAKTYPALYANVDRVFPPFPKRETFITAWFPLYPALIRLANIPIGDFRTAALIVSWAAGGVAVVLFHELAKDYIKHPFSSALLFSFFPAAWLMGGTLAFVEAVYVCAFLACVLAFVRGRTGWAALFAALVVLSQKSGLLVVPLLIMIAKPRRRALAPCLSALAAAAALQVYLWHVFGDPLINMKTHREIFGGSYFGLPFFALVRGLFDSSSPFRGLFWTRKAVILVDAAFYVGIFAWACRRAPEKLRPFMFWLGICLVFYASLTGASAFYAFPRFMTVAAPPAVLLFSSLIDEKPRWRIAVLALLPVVLLWNALDAVSGIDLATRYWTPEYYRVFLAFLNRS